MFYSLMISSQGFSEPTPLDCELHNYLSALFFLLCDTGWLEWGGAGYVLSPGSDNIPVVRLWVTTFSCGLAMLRT